MVIDTLAIFRSLEIPPTAVNPLIALAWDHFPRKSSAEGYIYLLHLLTAQHQAPDIVTAVKVGSFMKGICSRVGKYESDIADRQWCSDQRLKRLILAQEQTKEPITLYFTPLEVHPLKGLVTREEQWRQTLQPQGYKV